MKAVIVYESMYGNTHGIAEAIAEGVHEVQPDATVACIPVAEAVADVTRSADLLVVGGPTHMHGMSSGLSPKMAVSAEAKRERAKVGEPPWSESPLTTGG
ncbi:MULTISPECIES: flavodoxin domain-containing protein [unclassified Kitasatospora]|uniref:flavodoxin family protein n=1 Tax=unclassified Kitasatospora TaxID=2633591 RepID=UPI0033EBC22C